MKKSPRTEGKISLHGKQVLDSAGIDVIIQGSHAFNLFREQGKQQFLSIVTPDYWKLSRPTVVKRLKPFCKRNRMNAGQTLSMEH